MSVTAHKIQQTFHVDLDQEFGIRAITDTLKTEAGDVITTEIDFGLVSGGQFPLETEEFEASVVWITAHKTGHNSFIATNQRITGG